MNAPVFRQPFHPASDFVATRAMTLNGVDLKDGDPVDTTGVEVRVLRALYDQRKIDYASVVPNKATLEGTPQATLEARLEARLEGTLEATPQATPEPIHADGYKKDAAHRVKHAGLGGWKVLDPKGAPIGPGFKTKAEAEARAAELNAKK